MNKEYFCVLDFEATCDDKIKGMPYEIIEFPSVLYKLEDKKLIFVVEFQQYCKPQQNPKLTKFCTDLTGIEQKTVDDAEIFPVVLKNHYEWLVKQTGGELQKVIFVTCGSWDFETAMKAELARWYSNKEFIKNNSPMYDFITGLPNVYKSFVNIKDVFMGLYGHKAGGMVSMLNYLKLGLLGKHHSGKDDTRSISSILIQMFNHAEFDINKHIIIKKVDYTIKKKKDNIKYNTSNKL
ncbi:MAG: exonuclease [Edafosvirus sp.]|uniref:Exonuclease n=1 Tax=Edafosvirus sp. TaxID=2487765 RepID=A0A3G4ZSJ1_9VIRU|nr:MAG: exonuclease [Edafosvirus sp.]